MLLTGEAFTQVVTGTNTYAINYSPRTSGTEAMVISASWLSRTGEGDGTLNLRGVSTVLALAGFLKRELVYCACNARCSSNLFRILSLGKRYSVCYRRWLPGWYARVAQCISRLYSVEYADSS